MKFTKIILSLFLIFSFVSNLFSQKNDSGSDSTRTNGLYAGSWALQFKISSVFTLDSFNGANLAMKYHFTKNSALRFGVTIKTFNRDMTKDDRYTGSYENSLGNSEINRDNFEVTLRPLYILYPKVNKTVLLYLGTGPYLLYGNYNYHTQSYLYRADTLQTTIYRDSDKYMYSIGVAAVIGVEVFVTNYLSLHAEYGSNLYYYYSEEKSKHITDNNGVDNSNFNDITKTKGIYFSASSVLFGVSLYF